ncbi:MAG: OmpA family protein, partial [Roseibium sp.]
FFMLMWLLNATTEKQRKGIADYFNPTIPINRISGGGNDLFGGDSVLKEQFLANNGIGGLPTTLSGGAKHADADGDMLRQPDKLAEIQDLLIGGGGESFLADNSKKHVITRLTDEGLVIELFDTPQAQLFVEGQAKPYRLLVDLVRIVTQASQLVNNDVSVEGHIRTVPVVQLDKATWELSSDRANTVRGLLESHGLTASRISRVTGHADRDPVSSNPRALQNNRIEVILLRRDLQ